MIIFKPYKLSGPLMTLCLLAGYILCFVNMTYIAQSVCRDNVYGKLSSVNTIVFLIGATFTVIFAHIIFLIPAFKNNAITPTKKVHIGFH